MSPKRAAISVALLSSLLTLIITLSSAAAECRGFDSVSDVLQHYDIPTWIFPNDVQQFYCRKVRNKDALLLTIKLKGVCKTPTPVGGSVGYGNTFVFQPEISALVSEGQLTHIKGVTFELTKIIGEVMTLIEVEVRQTPFGIIIRFVYDKGASPWFPLNFIPSDPPICEYSSAFGHSGSGGVEHGVPIWVYEYGRAYSIP